MSLNTILVLTMLSILAMLWWLTRRHAVKMYRFYRPGCGWCKQSQPEWDKFKSQCWTKNISIIDINMDHATKEEQDLFDYYGGKTVPKVVRVYHNGVWSLYTGDRLAKSYMDYATEF